jgi:hypothetical protein
MVSFWGTYGVQLVLRGACNKMSILQEVRLCGQTFMYPRHCLITVCADTYTFSPVKFIFSYEVIDNFEKGFSSCIHGTKRPHKPYFRVHTAQNYQISII